MFLYHPSTSNVTYHLEHASSNLTQTVNLDKCVLLLGAYPCVMTAYVFTFL